MSSLQKQVTSTAADQSFNYSGRLVIKEVQNDTVLSTRIVSNHGKISLFTFLCNALCGELKPLQCPQYLCLFAPKNLSADSLETADITDAFSNNGELTEAARSLFLKTPQTFTLEDGTPYASFSFSIPFTLITADTIVAFALYSGQIGTNSAPLSPADALAYYVLTDVNGMLQPISTGGEDITQKRLVVEWNLSINNSNDYTATYSF